MNVTIIMPSTTPGRYEAIKKNINDVVEMKPYCDARARFVAQFDGENPRIHNTTLRGALKVNRASYARIKSLEDQMYTAAEADLPALEAERRIQEQNSKASLEAIFKALDYTNQRQIENITKPKPESEDNGAALVSLIKLLAKLG